ncbi:DegT/DnrJ/EryC1/StrS family aminotransferase [Halobaculum sp. D14]|uniref:DegT/DnrJ/EryC1/StrS family aminotransferase n=1 Tax=Halobaculum sp. D14 TaxID=3421642 RepID=UPI003EB7EE98
MTDHVPFTDIYVDDDIVDEVTEVLQSTRYVKGERLEQFEAAFAREAGVEHAVGLSSGTAALLLALEGLGLGDGDDVFVPGLTFFATASTVLRAGATPKFVDVDPETYTMDPAELEQAVEASENPAAVVPVHIYGQMADMEAINRIADEHDLAVVEDACQAHFAERGGELAGTAGDAGAFSFYPSKNMTVGGDGGMLVTDAGGLADKARALRNHGRGDDGVHRYLGLNFRLDEVSAVVGDAQLDHIRAWNDGRRRAAHRYTDALADVDEVVTPTEAEDATHVYHLYVVQAPDRDALRAHLDDRGIDTGVHYPTPLHEHPAIEERVGDVTLERTEALCDRIVSLPMHPRLSDEEIDEVCAAIEEFYR